LLLKKGTVVDDTLISAPSSTKNSTGTCDPEMHQTKKGNQWHPGMKVHIGSDADQGLMPGVKTTAANAQDVTQAHALLHGEETDAFAETGYRGVEKREEIQTKHPQLNWHIAMMPVKRQAMNKCTPIGAILEKRRPRPASAPRSNTRFGSPKRQFGYIKVKSRGLPKNKANLMTLFELPNI
jgi:IS5 family transposase